MALTNQSAQIQSTLIITFIISTNIVSNQYKTPISVKKKLVRYNNAAPDIVILRSKGCVAYVMVVRVSLLKKGYLDE